MKFQVQSRRLLTPITNKWMMISIVPHRPIATQQASRTSTDPSNNGNPDLYKKEPHSVLDNEDQYFQHHPTPISVYQVSSHSPSPDCFSSTSTSDIFSPTVNTVFDE